MAEASKKFKAPKRKGKKQYTMVPFELEEFEGEFVLPQLDQLPLGVAAGLSDGDILGLVKFLDVNAPECAEAIRDLGGSEVEELLQKWGDASGADMGKSAA